MNAAKYVLAGDLAVVGPSKPAVVNGEESISYGNLAVRVSRFAAALRKAGMTPGDRVALFMLDHADLVSVYLAVMAAGGVAIAVSTRATSEIFGTSLRLPGHSPSSPKATSHPR
jgi:acyl-CoA synthetase (AMP-forming)/AMP-acid ligase II